MQQNIKMLPQRNGLLLMSPLKILCVLVFHLLLTHSCRGQSQLISPSQPIVARVGDDVILPCYLEPAMDVVAMTMEWKRPEPNPMFVHVRRAGQDLVLTKHPSYKDRTSVSVDELKHGNISLKLSTVKPSDNGTYQCYIPKLSKLSSVELVVASGAVSLPAISLAGIDRNQGGVVLHCESTGWHPEPEVMWLDGEGNVLSAGPTETVRGPDDLYTVSSRVTVEKRHSNNFTCRVQQKIINQSRDTDFYIPDDFFKFQSTSSTVTVGFAVGLAFCILTILLLVFLLWRQNRIREKKNQAENQFVAEDERQRVPLRTDETVEMKDLKKGKGKKKSKHLEKQLQEEQQRTEQQREETESRLKTLKEELEIKKNEVETKQAELQQLHEEKQRNEMEMQNLKEELKNKEQELVRIQTAPYSSSYWFQGRSKEEKQRGEAQREAQNEVETLKKKLEPQETELETKIKEFEDKQAEVQQLQDEVQRMETDLQTLVEDLDFINMELESIQVAPAQSSSSRWPIVSRQKFQDEQQRRAKAENQVVLLMKKLQREVDKLTEEKKKSENEQQQLKTELDTKKKEWKQQLRDEQQKTKKAEEALTKLEKLFRDEETKRQKAEEESEKIRKAKEKLQEQDNSSATVPIIGFQVDRTDKRIYLINMSAEEQRLGGWKLQIQINNREPFIRIYEKSYKLRPGWCDSLKLSDYDSQSTHQLFWEPGDKLHICLFSNTGKIKHLSFHTHYITNTKTHSGK